MRSVATKIFLTFACAFVAFGLVAAFGIARLHALGQDLKLLSEGYLPLTRLTAQIEVKDWVASRVLEAGALDPAARRAYLPVARAHFPEVVRDKIAEARRVAARARSFARPADAAFLDEVDARLAALDAKWSQYDAASKALFDLIEAGDGGATAALEGKVQQVRTLEKRLSLDVKLLAVALENQIGDRVHAAERAESRTVALIVIYSLLAAAVGAVAAFVSQRLLAPIRKLTEGVKAVAAGDLSRQVEVRSGDEIGLLAREFNAMAGSLERQRKELLRAERLAAVGRISAQITHEIRNPLNAIGLNTELLGDELDRIEEALAARGGDGRAPMTEVRALLRTIGREVDRLNGVTEEYLRFARLPKPQLAREDLNEILSGLLDFVAPELAAGAVEVERELAPGLPPVLADEGQLRAAFLNLLRNSREAMPQGGQVRVRTALAADGAVEAAVADTGPGIPPDALSRIFDPFYSTKKGGTGLGLAFTAQVVKEHGGTVRCESAPGRGAMFTVRIPPAPEERRALPAPQKERQSA